MSETTLILRSEMATLGEADLPGTQRKRILLVEGDGFTRLVLLLRLRLAGFGVDFTSNGMLGLGKLRSCNPDILLIELKLCGMSGLELIKAARADPRFADRPIYVFTHVARMNRATRKEVGQLVTKVFDKSSISREDLVQTFVTTFLSREPDREEIQSTPAAARADIPAEPPPEALSETVLPGAIEEIVAGVREQSELLVHDSGERAVNGGELLSRVYSLASCAEAAGLPNLARQARALENFLSKLGSKAEAYTDAALSAVTRAVEVMSRMSFERNGQEQPLTRFTAVLVDEAPRSNQTLERALLNAGFEPVCFEEPARARAYLASNRTELIIANVVLPEAHSLALADIRQLPLHEETPVVFGPDSTVTAPLGERLPTSAARLDNEPLLLAELVVRALNEVQSTETPAQACAAPAPPTPDPVGQPSVRTNAAAGLAFDDGFELFSRAGSISSEPLHRAEPSTPAEDREAELLVRLPESSTDGSQIEEQPLEAVQPPALQIEAPLPPEAEPTAEDQTATATWLAASANETGQSVPVGNAASELQQNEFAVGAEPAAATSNYEEFMNNQVGATPVESLQPGQVSQPGEMPEEQRSERDDLAARVYTAEMEVYRVQGEMEQKDAEIQALQKQLAEVTAGQPAGHHLAADIPAEGAAAEQRAQVRCAELEQELASLRQAFDDFSGGFGQQQQAAAETGKYIEELEQRLSQNSTEQEKQKEEQQRADAELRRQLEAAEAASQQAAARCTQLEQELDSLRQAREELANKLAQEQKVNAESGARLKKLEAQSPPAEAASSDPEQQVRQGVAALARATAELAKERGERQRSEQRTAELNERLQGLHQDLSRTLQAQREDLTRISALEEQQDQTRQELDRRTADVEQLQAERQLVEEQLQKAKEINAQLRKDLSFFDETNKKFGGARQELHAQLEASLSAAREHEAMLAKKSAEQQRLAESLDAVKQELQQQTRRREALEQELKTAHETLQEREAKLQKETAERQRLNEALDSAHRNVRGGSERDLEFSKLQSALQLEQVERKRQEAELARLRHSALDSAHAARSLRAGLRRQIREPVENLVHSTRSLLELEMDERQKKLAEAVLQDVLLVQTRLREPEQTPGESAEPPAPPSKTGT